MNKNIVITGASSEIGKAIITKLSNKEHHFILQTTGKISDFEDFLSKLLDDFEVFKVDFRDNLELLNFCKVLKEVDLLINIAGVTKNDLLPMLSDENISEMVGVNIIALIKTCQSVVSYMSSSRKGCIINISSIAATKANRGQTVYAGTKGFTESFSRALAAEYGSRGVRVNCIAPGPIDAGKLKDILIYAPDEIKGNLLSKKLGTPEDIANLTAFLSSDESQFINGQVIKIDGGFMKGIT